MPNRFLFKALSMMQFLIFLIFAIAGLYLFAMAYSGKAQFGDADTVQRHAFTAIIVSLFFLAPLIGMWRRERWAWWMGLSVNFVCLALSYWALVYNKPDVGWGDIAGPVLFFITVVLHLLSRPGSWKSLQTGDSLLFKKAL